MPTERDRAALVILNYQPVPAKITVRLDAAGLLPGASGVPGAEVREARFG
jgi:hypothetical protein